MHYKVLLKVRYWHFCWNQFDENSLKFSGTDIFPIHILPPRILTRRANISLNSSFSCHHNFASILFLFFSIIRKNMNQPRFVHEWFDPCTSLKFYVFLGIFFSSLYYIIWVLVIFESMFLLHPKTSSISLEIIFYAWLMVCQNWFVWKLTPYSCVFQNLSLYIAKRIITISEVLRYTLIYTI